jgi:quercetin dioxygenase-like cupin family protein/oxalate decarboxylase/phosphoglucose isomerase-like protein (cupin superfamily)
MAEVDPTMVRAESDMVREAEAYTSPYERWKRAEGLPTVSGYFVKNLLKLELAPWKSSGDGLAAIINLVGTGGFNDAYVCEIPAGKSLKPHRHLFEETIYILKGQGATSVWLDESKKQSFEWHTGSYFAIPMNAWHQHFNVSGAEAARYVAMTSAPRVIDTFDDYEFVFENPFVFKSRFKAEEGYFKEAERKTDSRRWETNFVADVMACQMNEGGRGVGVKSLGFGMVNGTMKSHSSFWPVGTYKKAHRHGPGIHVVILKGYGYSLMWQEGQEVERIDWEPGSVFVPPEMWFHQHFNAGKDPVLFLAIGWGSDKPKAGGKQYVYKSVKEGGDQIEYEDEDPQIHRDYEVALVKAGATCRMGGKHPFCTA